jgi:hypothetical protein
MTGSNINPPDYTDPIEELQNDRLSPNPKVISTNFSIVTSNINTYELGINTIKKSMAKIIRYW